MSWSRILAVACVVAKASGVLYLPGVAPRSYVPTETLKLYVNKLTSTHTQVRVARVSRVGRVASLRASSERVPPS